MFLSINENDIFYSFIFDYSNMLNYRQKAMFVYEKISGETCDIKKLLALSNDRRDSLRKELKRHVLPVEAYRSFQLDAYEHGVSEINHNVLEACSDIIEDRRLNWRDKGIAMYYVYSASLSEYPVSRNEICIKGADYFNYVTESIFNLIKYDYIEFVE